MKRIGIIITLLIVVLTGACQSTNKKMNQMEMKEKLINSLKKYSEKRMYYVHVNKGGCRFELSINDIHLENEFTEWASTGTTPMNLSILKSGKQRMKVKIYPTTGKVSLTDITRLQLTIAYGPTPKSSLEEQVILVDWNLPKEIIDKKLPYYETTLEFDAVVPYDFTYRLEGATDLRKIPNIEVMALNKMKEIQHLLEIGDVETYWNSVFNKFVQYTNSLYQTPEEIISDLEGDAKTTFGPHKNRKVLPIENYEVFYYANGKIITLLKRGTRDDLIRCTYIDEKGIKCNAWLIIELYMPKGSTELQIF